MTSFHEDAVLYSPSVAIVAFPASLQFLLLMAYSRYSLTNPDRISYNNDSPNRCM